MSNFEILYKYCSAESAKKILTEKTLRWRAPSLLNNPMGLDHNSPLPFTHEVLIKRAIKAAAAMIFSPEPPKGVAPLHAAIRRWREEDRFNSPEEAEEVLQELIAQVVDQRHEAVNQIVSDWQHFSSAMRICSFCHKPDNITNWQLASKNYSGAALRFSTSTAKSFGQPKDVNYVNERPAVTSLIDQLGIIINNERYVAQEHFTNKLITKPASLKSQQEVFCFHSITEEDPDPGDDPNQWFLDRAFEEEALQGVYFGLNTSLIDKQTIWDMVRKNFSMVKIYDSKLTPGKFELESIRLSDRPS